LHGEGFALRGQNINSPGRNPGKENGANQIVRAKNNNQGVSLVSDEMANNSFRELNQKFIKIILYFIT